MRKPNKLAPFSEGSVPPNGKEIARAALPDTIQEEEFDPKPIPATWVLYRLPGGRAPWTHYKVIRPAGCRCRLGPANFALAWNSRLADSPASRRLLPAVRTWAESVLRRPPASFRELVGE